MANVVKHQLGYLVTGSNGECIVEPYLDEHYGGFCVMPINDDSGSCSVYPDLDTALEAAEEYCDAEYSEEEVDSFNSDAEADADVLASAGWGTDEDYGYYGDEY